MEAGAEAAGAPTSTSTSTNINIFTIGIDFSVSADKGPFDLADTGSNAKGQESEEVRETSHG